MKLSKTIFASAAFLAAMNATPQAASAQGGMAMPAAGAKQPASPRDSIKVTVGGAQMSVNYGRPSKRGRTIFGGLNDMKWGMVWRMGANEATTLTTTKPLQFGMLQVPAGTYTIRVLLEESGQWQFIINKQTGQWGTEYKPELDVGRVPMTVTHLATVTEQMEITVVPTAKGGELTVAWDQTKASVAFVVK